MQCSACSVQCAVCSEQSAVFSVQCTDLYRAVCSVQCTACSLQCAVLSAAPQPSQPRSLKIMQISAVQWLPSKKPPAGAGQGDGRKI